MRNKKNQGTPRVFLDRKSRPRLLRMERVIVGCIIVTKFQAQIVGETGMISMAELTMWWYLANIPLLESRSENFVKGNMTIVSPSRDTGNMRYTNLSRKPSYHMSSDLRVP